MGGRTATPGGTVEHFSELLEAGRLDDLLNLYEEGATFVPRRGAWSADARPSATSSPSSPPCARA